MRVRIARLHMEAQERSQNRQAELDLWLQVRKLEIDADKKVKLQQLDIRGGEGCSGFLCPAELLFGK